MPFSGFTETDFDVFAIPGLEQRMEALIREVRPKLTEIGERTAPVLSALCGEPMFAHVAKHARRTVHPPQDTWVAWSDNKRGYKAQPHFQVGLWETHLFIQFALIYESAGKEVFADKLSANWRKIKKAVPAGYYWSDDHTRPEVTPHASMREDDFGRLAHKLKHIKKAEVLCGIQIRRGDPLLHDGEALLDKVEKTFETLMPLYKLARN